MDDERWNPEAGTMVFVYVENYITGRRKRAVIGNNYLMVEDVLYKLCSELGFSDCVWATFDARNDEAACVVSFNNYVAYYIEQKSHY